ncbi:MAG: energy transducer TonB [Erythrobacter sp.]
MRVLAVIFALAMAGASMTAAQTGETDGLTLQPSSPWRADFGEENCVLTRQFGQGDDAVLLELAQFQPGNSYGATIVGKGFDFTGDPVLYRFLPAQFASDPVGSERVRFDDKYEGLSFRATLTPAETAPIPVAEMERPKAPRGRAGMPASIAVIPPLTGEDLESRAAKITALTIERSLSRKLTLVTGQMDGVVRVMRQCMDDLVTSWGIPRQPDGSVVPMAKALNPKVLSQIISQEYPTDALRAEASATLPVRLLIDAAGEISSCSVQTPQKFKSFEETVCKAFKKSARFELPKDAGGASLPSYYTTNVTFLID